MANEQPAYTASNVLVGQAAMYLQLYNPSVPATLPADTVALNTAWGGSWVPVGASDDGVTLNFQRNTNNILIEEQQTPVLVLSESTDVSVGVTLAEDTLTSMMNAMGGGTITVTPAASGVPGIAVLQLADDLVQYAVGFEGKNQYGFWRRCLFQPCVSTGKIAAKFRRAKDKRMYQTEFPYTGAVSSIVIREMNAVALP